ncbi:uncharacterized protein LOC100900388 [Galendromus occidentalis]|uniref:Uncharacterized protein LOC100900388 n=1 Tax=Galendromus occidentalis TaxID=34638 RepID=A0AAJ6VVJ2_9ACAR|nr:uncharacterized protein LOC100900388 [Galendromus occidentalis]
MWCAILLCLSGFAQLCLSGYYGGGSSAHSPYSDQDFSGFDSGPLLPSIPGLGMALSPNELQNILSSFTMSSVDRIPAVASHVYGSPQKLIISDYQGPTKKFYGTVRSFHQVRTLDHGGNSLASNSYNQNPVSTGFEDFMFPADW